MALGVLTNDENKEGDLSVILAIRDKVNRNKITVVHYGFEEGTTIVNNIKYVYEIENPTNIFSKNYITPIITNTITEKTNKYFNITIEEATQNRVVLKDWNNKKHNLNNIGILFTESTNWSHVSYNFLYVYNEINNKKNPLSSEETNTVNELIKNKSPYIYK